MSTKPKDPRDSRWPVPEGYPVHRCRSCGMQMMFTRTSTGKLLPLSLRTEPLEVERDGKTVTLEPSVVVVDDEQWALPHFVDCKDADKWRNR